MPQGAGRHVRSARKPLRTWTRCGVIVLTTDPEDRDGWTQHVVDRNKKCCGERQIKELANIGKLEVAEIMLQEARAQATQIVYAGWLDDAARGTTEDPAADRSSEDATTTASRIMMSMEATKDPSRRSNIIQRMMAGEA